MKISSQDINGANVNWKTMPAFVCVFVHMAVRCLVCKGNILNTYDSVLPSVFIHFHWNSYFTNCFSHSFFLADVLCMHVCAYKFYIPLSNCSNRMKYSKFVLTPQWMESSWMESVSLQMVCELCAWINLEVITLSNTFGLPRVRVSHVFIMIDASIIRHVICTCPFFLKNKNKIQFVQLRCTQSTLTIRYTTHARTLYVNAQRCRNSWSRHCCWSSAFHFVYFGRAHSV